MDGSAQLILDQIREVYEAQADPDRGEAMSRYMRSLFPFYGIPQPRRQELSKQVILSWGGPLPDDTAKALCRLCFGPAENREVQYFVNDYLRARAKKLAWSWVALFEELIQQKSWWDSVDFLAPKLAGAVMKRHPEPAKALARQWIASDNFWLQRSAILFQLDYKEDTDWPLLQELILARAGSGEFFVQRAAGWALRQYGRKNPTGVAGFLDAHRHQLSKLTLREGGKYVLEPE